MQQKFDPNLINILKQESLQWIFVGGKGGVGKTTTSSSLGLLLAQQRRSVLIISTDPAHNLSDAFDQKLGSQPTLIQGTTNLYGMEIEPKINTDQLYVPLGLQPDEQTKNLMNELVTSVPGVDEAMSFAELMRTVNQMEFQTIIFDTAPTGHTLRLLNFPNLLEKGLNQLVSLKEKFGGMIEGFMGQMNTPQEVNVFERMEQMQAIVKIISDMFKNPEKTTFVAVCIPEFLSMYETERLVQELVKFDIDIRNIVINQVVIPEGNCKLCNSRSKMQKKYIEQIEELYEDFHIVKVPLGEEEIRGIEKLKEFGKGLIQQNP